MFRKQHKMIVEISLMTEFRGLKVRRVFSTHQTFSFYHEMDEFSFTSTLFFMWEK